MEHLDHPHDLDGSSYDYGCLYSHETSMMERPPSSTIPTAFQSRIGQLLISVSPVWPATKLLRTYITLNCHRKLVTIFLTHN
ncbi:hypothetical protein QC761_606250 [Podospora bellae-mahoneyi]|uniref:Uncharacterized protein n=1 Tax=Podospora bellae-mahoneyi TaxID=2093777 RepID=A0ABR0F9T8_9PEZI|nr:hypothetical protein QC761_606250 [Podospora bellae-mahoneyi]